MTQYGHAFSFSSYEINNIIYLGVSELCLFFKGIVSVIHFSREVQPEQVLLHTPLLCLHNIIQFSSGMITFKLSTYKQSLNSQFCILAERKQNIQKSDKLNIASEWLAFLLQIQEVLSSNLGSETGYSD
jgi:hypothetical protein